MRARGRILTAIAVSSAVFLGGCSADEPEPSSDAATSASSVGSPSVSAGPTPLGDAGDDERSAGPEVTGPEVEREEREPEEREPEEREPTVRSVSVLGLAEQRHRGDRLRLGAVRERTPEYTSYDVSYRSRTTTRGGEESYTITGVLNVPTGRGLFPVVVLAHGYIDPAIYVRGRE